MMKKNLRASSATATETVAVVVEIAAGRIGLAEPLVAELGLVVAVVGLAVAVDNAGSTGCLRECSKRAGKKQA